VKEGADQIVWDDPEHLEIPTAEVDSDGGPMVVHDDGGGGHAC
jgi:hypothetical protein